MANKPRPLLILGDAVSAPTGLARITRDLATRIHQNLSDVYRVATFGYGGPGSSKFGFPQFVIEGMHDWVCPSLPEVCHDFFGKERGIVLAVWDLNRLTWLAAPAYSAEPFEEFPGLQQWLVKEANFDKWIYCPMDASGPNDKLTFPIMRTLLGFDRILAYTRFGEGVIRRTIGDEEAEKRHIHNLPHGIDTDTFFDIGHKAARTMFYKNLGVLHAQKTPEPLQDDDVLIGIVATNQARKDWSLGIETCAILATKHKIRLWLHTDKLERDWSIVSLLLDYGLLDNTVISLGYVEDRRMAELYAACNLTLGIGPEGFGYPAAESLACETPVITGSYAGASDFVPAQMQVSPIVFRYEGVYSSKRPVYRAEEWAAKAEAWIGRRTSLDPRYEWNNLWENEWEPWLREAAK